jgi:Leucine-rich repeat (LRR) protein
MIGAEDVSLSKPKLDCSQFANDFEILASFPFINLINPSDPYSGKTYAIVNDNRSVVKIYIGNESFVPLTVFCFQSLEDFIVINSNFQKTELNENSVRQLPPEIERFATSLKGLSLYNTAVTHLPASFGKLKNLE